MLVSDWPMATSNQIFWKSLKSSLVFHPRKKDEIWRFITYQLCHGSFNHIFGNMLVSFSSRCWRQKRWVMAHRFGFCFQDLLMRVQSFQLQLYLGIPLEMVHGTIRIGLVYTSGVLMGSLFSSIIDASRQIFAHCVTLSEGSSRVVYRRWITASGKLW